MIRVGRLEVGSHDAAPGGYARVGQDMQQIVAGDGRVVREQDPERLVVGRAVVEDPGSSAVRDARKANAGTSAPARADGRPACSSLPSWTRPIAAWTSVIRKLKPTSVKCSITGCRLRCRSAALTSMPCSRRRRTRAAIDSSGSGEHAAVSGSDELARVERVGGQVGAGARRTVAVGGPGGTGGVLDHGRCRADRTARACHPGPRARPPGRPGSRRGFCRSDAAARSPGRGSAWPDPHPRRRAARRRSARRWRSR